MAAILIMLIVLLITLCVCVTINSIHERNKKVEVAIEALKQGHSVILDL